MTIDRMWLIRRTDRSYSRPLSEAQLLKMFENGEMNQMDELCCSMEYWFSIQDVNEMRKYFGELSLEGIFKRQTEEPTQGGGSTAKIVLTPNQLDELKKKTTDSTQSTSRESVEASPIAVPQPISTSSIRSIKALENSSEHAHSSAKSQRVKNLIFGALAILIVLWVLFWMG